MTLPSYFNVQTQGNELKGIIYEIKEKYKIDNPVSAKIIEPKSIGASTGSLDSIVLWNEDVFSTSVVENAWIQIGFPRRFIFPTAYSFRGPLSSNWRYAKAWNVYGIHEEDDDKSASEWDLLGSNKTSESTYCVTLTSYEYCEDRRVGTFNLKPMKSSIGYRYIRWVATEGGGDSTGRWTISGLDVYGTLSSSNLNINDQKLKHVCELYLIKHVITAAAGNAMLQK